MNLGQAFYIDEERKVPVLRPGVLCGALAYEALRCPPIVIEKQSAIPPTHPSSEREPGRRGLRPGIPRRTLEALAGMDRPTALDLAPLVGEDRRTVARALNELRDMGLVQVSGRNKPQRHWITEKGRRELEIIKMESGK